MSICPGAKTDIDLSVRVSLGRKFEFRISNFEMVRVHTVGAAGKTRFGSDRALRPLSARSHCFGRALSLSKTLPLLPDSCLPEFSIRLRHLSGQDRLP